MKTRITTLLCLALLHAAPALAQKEDQVISEKQPLLIVQPPLATERYTGPRVKKIDWTEWHRRISCLLIAAYDQARSENKYASGNTLARVEFSKNHEITVHWIRATSYESAGITKRVYEILNGRRELQFPVGSERQTATYNLPAIFTFTSPMRPDYINNDFEWVVVR